jgi:4-hydroxythreonine-4-phosphate dehydrogenase
VALAMSGAVDAIVTGPAEKRALQGAGVPFPGHTEWLGALAGGPTVTISTSAGGSWSTRAAISGPMPRGSPSVSAIRGRTAATGGCRCT